MSETPVVPADDSSKAELTKAVQELVKSVKALDRKLKSNYPDRDEVRRQGRRRAVQFLAFGLVIVLVAQILTLATVSYCFLAPQPGEPKPMGCVLIPGYARAIEDSNARLDRFNLVLSQIEKNQAEIKLLHTENRVQEERLKELEGR